MDVSLTDEQQQWQDAVRRLAEAHAVTGPEDLPADERGWEEALALGIPALRSPATSGVAAAGVESALAVEQLARQLSTVPVVGQGVLAPELLDAAGAEDLLVEVAEGAVRLAPGLSADLADFGRLGQPTVALDTRGATHALLLDGAGDAVRLVVVPVEAPPMDALDLTRSVHPIPSTTAGAGEARTGGPIGADRLDRARAVALTAFAADLLGVMDAAVADAVQHALDRHQFGRPVGAFQAVQHLLAHAAVLVEGARSCVWHAAWAGDHLPPAEALLAARTAKAYCSQAGIEVVEATVQVFGGMAITWEHPSHLRLRRAHLDRQCLGAEDVHQRLIADQLLAGAGAGEVAA